MPVAETGTNLAILQIHVTSVENWTSKFCILMGSVTYGQPWHLDSVTGFTNFRCLQIFSMRHRVWKATPYQHWKSRSPKSIQCDTPLRSYQHSQSQPFFLHIGVLTSGPGLPYTALLATCTCKTNVCSLHGAIASPAYYSLALQVHDRCSTGTRAN